MPSPEHDAVVALLRELAAERGDRPMSVEESRQQLDANGDLFSVPATVRIESFEAAGIGCERYVPDEVLTDGLFLYFHGGAYVSGSLRSHRPVCGRIAHAAGTELVAVDYRLAPEHRHPAALEDAVAVYRWLLDEGGEASRIVLAGDSAGGGLTTAALLALQSSEAPIPAGAVLISPWLDLTLSGDSIVTAADVDPMLQAASLASSAESYAGSDVRATFVSPIFATPQQLSGLPPMLLLAGTADILVDDSRAFAHRARAAGADVSLNVEDGLVHVWPFIDGIPEAAAAMDRIASWIRARVGEPS